MNRPADPWQAYRARFGALVPALRVIDVKAGTDEIRPLQAMPNHGELSLDGCTLIIGLERGIDDEERRAVIERFDAAWRERQQATEKARR